MTSLPMMEMTVTTFLLTMKAATTSLLKKKRLKNHQSLK